MLDEPTSSLDDAATEQLEAVLRRQLSANAHLVLVSHDSDQPARLGLPVRRLVAGQLAAAEPVAETAA